MSIKIPEKLEFGNPDHIKIARTGDTVCDDSGKLILKARIEYDERCEFSATCTGCKRDSGWRYDESDAEEDVAYQDCIEGVPVMRCKGCGAIFENLTPEKS